MSNRCADTSTCPDGNCEGCKNGEIFPDDPRCYPDCPDAKVTTSSGNWIIITIILILLGALLVMAFIVGFDWFNKSKKAAEPKNVTVNKHIHNIKQPSIVVSPAPAPIVTTVTPVITSRIVTPTVNSFSPVSYSGTNLTMNDCPFK